MAEKDRKPNKPEEKTAGARLEALEEAMQTAVSLLQDLSEKVLAMEKRLDGVEKATGKPKGLFGGKRERVAIKDTQTKKVYVSKAACGKALAAEADTIEDDHFAYYKLVSKFPDRFVEASAEEKAKVEAEEEAARAAAEKAAAEEEAKAAAAGAGS